MGLKSLYNRIIKYNTKRKILKVLGDIKQFSKDQREKAVNILLAVHERADGILESILKKECSDDILTPLEKNYYLVKDNGRYSLGRFVSEKLSNYRKDRIIAYAPFMRT